MEEKKLFDRYRDNVAMGSRELGRIFDETLDWNERVIKGEIYVMYVAD